MCSYANRLDAAIVVAGYYNTDMFLTFLLLQFVLMLLFSSVMLSNTSVYEEEPSVFDANNNCWYADLVL